ncbi:hypothetical protein B8W90_13720, partial [Staphylococcus hominis]
VNSMGEVLGKRLGQGWGRPDAAKSAMAAKQLCRGCNDRTPGPPGTRMACRYAVDRVTDSVICADHVRL